MTTGSVSIAQTTVARRALYSRASNIEDSKKSKTSVDRLQDNIKAPRIHSSDFLIVSSKC